MVETQILQEILQRVTRVETKIDSYNGLRDKIDSCETKLTETEARSKSNTHRINKVESNLTWLWRTIAGALIVIVVGGLFVIR